MIESLNILFPGRPAADYGSIPAIPPAESYELSHAQKRIWLAERSASENLRYNMFFCSTIKGVFDVEVLKRAIDAVIMRHESLRTTFIFRNGTPRQQICPDVLFNLKINHLDISNYEHREELMDEIIQEEKVFPFNLDGGPLLRATLVQQGAADFVFMFSVHHIISDDWSLEIVTREIFTIYHAYSRQLDNPLFPLRIQYKDFVAWRNSQLEGKQLEKLESYWLGSYNNATTVEFPADFPGNSLVFPGEANIDFEVSARLTALLNNAARLNDVTLFTVLVAAISILLNRYTGQRDIVIGTPVTMRNHPELEDQVGLYIDLMPLRVNLDPATDRFKDVLKKIKQTLNEVLAHDLYPYDMLMEKLSLSNQKIRSGLVNVLVQSQYRSPAAFPEIPDMSISSYLDTSLVDKVNLTFSFRKAGDHLRALIVYNDALFKPSSISQVCENLVYIADKVLANESLVIEDIQLMGPGAKN